MLTIAGVPIGVSVVDASGAHNRLPLDAVVYDIARESWQFSSTVHYTALGPWRGG